MVTDPPTIDYFGGFHPGDNLFATSILALDASTGEPVWEIEERPVPQSDVPGEQMSPIQPFVTRPAPYEMQGITEDDLIDFTPELRAMAMEIVKDFRLGPLFNPPSRENAPDGRPGPSLRLRCGPKDFLMWAVLLRAVAAVQTKSWRRICSEGKVARRTLERLARRKIGCILSVPRKIFTQATEGGF